MESVELCSAERSSFSSLQGRQSLARPLYFSKDNLSAKGEGVPKAFESVYQSSHLNVVQDLADNTAAQHLTHSTIWSRLGINDEVILPYPY